MKGELVIFTKEISKNFEVAFHFFVERRKRTGLFKCIETKSVDCEVSIKIAHSVN